MMGYAAVALVGLLIVLIVRKLWEVLKIVVWRPYAITKTFQKQGIRGPPYKLLYGCLDEVKKMKKLANEKVLDTNCHDITSRVLPHYHKWFSEFGDTLLYWYGTHPRITITNPELAKQILSNKFGFYGRPKTRPILQNLVGYGLILVEGLDWVRHRRVLNPAFSIDKLKIMTKKMAECTISMLDEWKILAVLTEEQRIKIEMNANFQKLTADIIAHTAFGSSYVEGKEVFKALKELQKCCVASDTDIFIPGSQYLPTPSNLQMWKLSRKLKNSLKVIIESRLSAKAATDGHYGDDLLGIMIESSVAEADGDSKVTPKLNMKEIMENCKSFFFAGHETTSNLLTWSVFLLSTHPEWHEKLREEVLTECGMGIPDADMLSKLKFVNMFLLEVLRLYCPVIMLIRRAPEDMKLGNLMIPKETCLTIPLVKIHRSKEYWGEDANEFKPLRFASGVSKAGKHPNALLAFSIGPRVCIGQNFAMLEAKTVLALILQRFSLSLSPEYKHAPIDHVTLHPQYGLPIIVKSLL
ncbi:cytochrome P450 709B2 [Manihot esculenta]|uniref:Cytochrome P450 n=1 Tax=Manihot esculenta TaxID=3983 RepID=A0A2C9VS64_MANES|nr:cytochrome P450 709B2 [Manihot esculenta]OAY48819.1 hypothetical protein MANES_05G007700v8 [Manihot esculenta]